MFNVDSIAQLQSYSFIIFVTAVLFIVTIIIRNFFRFKNGTNRSLISTKRIDDEYIAVLRRLFEPVVNTSSRHSGNDDERIRQRKTFFNKIFNRLELADCKVIHVAGTKGKGSTVEYISSGLLSSGHSVGIFTSPHLHTARERIKLGRNLISKEDMKKPDYLVIECGIGGRYDSTNIFDNPIATVITPISLDHQALLGDTVDLIAWQKAGIMKPGSILFTPSSDAQPPMALKVLKDQANEVGSKFFEVDVNMGVLKSLGVSYDHKTQLVNICVANAVLKYLNISYSNWVKTFYWPCRMEVFHYKQRAIVLDGCHNGESVKLFLAALSEKFPGALKIVMFGAGQDKSVDSMIEELFHAADHIIMVQSSHFKSYTEEQLLSRARGRNDSKILSLPRLDQSPNAKSAERGTISQRLNQYLVNEGDFLSRIQGKAPAVLAICGSLFIAADARNALYKLSPALFSRSDWVRESDPVIL